MPRQKYANIGERIIANTRREENSNHAGEPCRLWTGRRGGNGRPLMNIRWQKGPRKGKVRTVSPYREALKFFSGVKIRKNQVVLHLCNNKLCVNPAHLRPGSQADNVRHCVESGRHKTPFRDPAKKAAI